MNSGKIGLWSGTIALEPPDYTPTEASRFVSIPKLIQPDPLACDLIAHFNFPSGGTDTIGNTQAVELPGNALYYFVFSAFSPGTKLKSLKA